MSHITHIQNALNSRGMAAKIASLSGVSAMTLSRIARGLVTNPGIETVRKIEAAMEQIEKESQTTEAEAAQ